MSKPSPLLETSWIRWADRGGLLRRDIEMVMEGLRVKSHLLKDLEKKVEKHRREDLEQLRGARLETWTRWDERLKRLEEWMSSGAQVQMTAGSLRDWQKAARWFDRAQTVSQQYTEKVERKAAGFEKRLADVGERLQQWMNRLVLEEMDLRGFMERQSDKNSEIFVSSARKQPHLDFVYAEREEEGRLSGALRAVRTSADLIVRRQSRVETMATTLAETSPAYFEIRKSNILAPWRHVSERYGQILEVLRHQSETFEEGRQRLRSIYEMVQRMRVVQDISAPAAKRPLLQRLFNIQDD